MMQIREATVGDTEEVIALMSAFHAESVYGQAPMDEPSLRLTIEMLTASAIGSLWVASTDDGRIVGVTGGLITPTWWNRNITSAAEFLWFVHPDHRRSKAGKLLFQALEAWAKDAGATYIMMASAAGKHQKRVNQIYEGRGYSPIETSYIKEL